MSDRAQARARSHDRHFSPITTHWMDDDAYGHVNNVVYDSFFDTVVNRWLIDHGVPDIHAGGVIGLVVETQPNGFASLAFPQTVDAGLSVARIGTFSVRHEVGLLAQGEPLSAAAGHFVHVHVDRATRRPTPLPTAQQAALQPLLTTP